MSQLKFQLFRFILGYKSHYDNVLVMKVSRMTQKISLTNDATLGPQTKWFKSLALKLDTDAFIDKKRAVKRINEITKAKNSDVERQIEHNLTTNEYSHAFNTIELEELHSLLTPSGLIKLRNTLSKAHARSRKKKISFQCDLSAEDVDLINDIVISMGLTREELMHCIAHRKFDHLKMLIQTKGA